MRYIGNKEKILPFIINTMIDTVGSLEGKTIADLFSGTVTVAKALKAYNCTLITNDYMNFSYVLQMAYIKNNIKPDFKIYEDVGKLNDYSTVLNYLNNLHNVSGFFYNNYTQEGSYNSEYIRNYFSEENAIKIDSIRTKLDLWHNSKIITDNEFFILLASLIDAVTKISNIAGTYGAFLKFDDKRKHNQLVLEPIDLITNNIDNHCFCTDAMELISNVSGDILYLDPPYNTRLYPPYYHILDTVALYDNPSIYGKTGRRPYTDKLSPFCYKDQVNNAFDYIVKSAKFKHIFISYSTEGLLQKEILYSLLKKYGSVEIFDIQHKRFKSNSYGNEINITKENLKELIFYVRKQ